MAAVHQTGLILRTSWDDPRCNYINRISWGSIWPWALAGGVATGALAAWAWSFNPLITLGISTSITLFAAGIFFLFQWPKSYAIQGWKELEDTSTFDTFRVPVISLGCGHTAERTSAFGFVDAKGKLKCTVEGCQNTFKKTDFVVNRLIVGLLNALHQDDSIETFKAFVATHLDKSCVLLDGHSCNILPEVLLMRARNHTGTWESFADENAEDLYRSTTREVLRVGVDENSLRSAFFASDEYDAARHEALEALYEKSVYNMLWEKVVDRYLQEPEVKA